MKRSAVVLVMILGAMVVVPVASVGVPVAGADVVPTLPVSPFVGWGRNSAGQLRPPLFAPSAVAHGYGHDLALNADGTITAWGDDSLGQTDVPADLKNVIAIAAGPFHSYAITRDGTAIGWGCYGETPQVTCYDRVAGTLIDFPDGSPATTVKAVSTNAWHTLALLGDGSVEAMGCSTPNNYGQCLAPIEKDFVAVAAGYDHSLALRADGTVVAWGCNTNDPENPYTIDFGQCDVPVGLSQVVAIAAGRDDSFALTSDGTVITWGATPGVSCNGAVPCGGRIMATNAAAIAGDGLILGRDGTILRGGPSGLTSVVALDGLSRGSDQGIALLADGTVTAWGCASVDRYGQCTVPPDARHIVSLAEGAYQTVALMDDGTVAAWGCAVYISLAINWGQCDVPAGLSGVVQVAADYFNTYALKSDGTVTAFGRVCSTEPCSDFRSLSNIKAMSNDGQYFIRDDGTVAGPAPAGLSDVVAVDYDSHNSLALKRDGTVVAWDPSGCPNGGAIDVLCTVPTGLTGVVAISAEYYTDLALKSDGTVVQWGCPTVITPAVDGCAVPAGLTGATAFAHGNGNAESPTIVIRNDGNVVAWGCNYLGYPPVPKCAIPAGLSGVKQAAYGDEAVVALRDPAATHIDYTGPTVADFNDPTTVSATLRGTNGAPLAGVPLTFVLDGRDVCSGATDATGATSCPLTPTDAAGTYTLTVTSGGDTSYEPTSTSTPFQVGLEEAALVYNGPTVVFNGSQATLTSTLTEDGHVPILGRAVTMTLHTAATPQYCAGTSDVNGKAVCTISGVAQKTGIGNATAAFRGDAYYRPANDKHGIIISPVPTIRPVPPCFLCHLPVIALPAPRTTTTISIPTG